MSAVEKDRIIGEGDFVEEKEGELYIVGKALNRLVQALYPNAKEALSILPQQKSEGRKSTDFTIGAIEIEEKAHDYWVRATKVISDLHNPVVKSVLLSEEIPNNGSDNEADKKLKDDSIRRAKDIVGRLSPDILNQARDDYRYLSGNGIMGNQIRESMLWNSIPIAAGESDLRIAGNVRLILESFRKASEKGNSLKP